MFGYYLRINRYNETTFKPKLKLKKSRQTDSEPERTGSQSEASGPAGGLPPVFGVPLELAVERNRSHDGISLPVVVRECIDYIEVRLPIQ